MKFNRPLWVAACCAIVVAAALTGASPARTTSDAFTKAGELITSLLIIALFVERSLAVINDIWLGAERRTAELKMQSAHDELNFVRKSMERERVTREAVLLEVARSGDIDGLNRDSSALRLLSDEIKAKEGGDSIFVGKLESATAVLSEVEARQADLRLRLGFGFALIISAVGVRTLASLFSLDSTGTEQSYAFRAADIVLTAGLIAGGSAGINTIAELLGKYIEASRKKVS